MSRAKHVIHRENQCGIIYHVFNIQCNSKGYHLITTLKIHFNIYLEDLISRLRYCERTNIG